jgi:hypothetical protein
MIWTIGAARIPGLWNVYDQDGNPLAEDKAIDTAMLIASTPLLLNNLAYIRDLARTGLAPTSFGLTEGQWKDYKLSKIAALAASSVHMVECFDCLRKEMEKENEGNS